MKRGGMNASEALQAELVQHLMDEGQATLVVLTQLTRYATSVVRDELLHLRQGGLCLRTTERDDKGRAVKLYALTPKGIEAALAAESVAV